jgi:catechol 2,3-dioxygenase-like lactoylglutathione lyase family enzyme
VAALQLRRVIVFSENIERLAEFYEEKLGLTPKAKEDDWIDYDAGGVRLALHRGKAGAGDGPGATKLCFHAPDIQRAADELVARGVKLGKVRGTPPGLVLCDFKDPDGNVLQLSSRA